jgi:hypothetical protein
MCTSASILPIASHAQSGKQAPERRFSEVWGFCDGCLPHSIAAHATLVVGNPLVDISKGWISLEYLVLLGIAFLFPCWGMITLLTVEMCIALVEPIAHLYYFSIHDALFSIRYLLYIPVHRLTG